MRKPSTPILEEAPIMPALPPSTRFGARSKRAKTTTDGAPRASKRARTQSDMANKTSTEQPTCIECKKKDTADRLINCTGKCSNKIHRSCLPPLFGGRKGQSYECNNCQLCSNCKIGFMDGAKLLKCYLCSACYHSTCYRPTSGENIRMLKEKRFCCGYCQNSQKTTSTKQNSISDRVARNATGVLYTVREARDSEIEDFLGFSQSDLPSVPSRRSRSLEPSKMSSIQSKSHSSDANNFVRRSFGGVQSNENVRNFIDRPNSANKSYNFADDENTIPDASEWTMNEVYEYFKKMFPRHAHVFEDEEIDGKVLYQLQREDVVDRFKLKIGPSLKIYNHILKMQHKLSNRS